jgi:hypothetical protein
MDLTGPYPKLTDADSVYAIKEYSELMAADVAAAVDRLPQGVKGKQISTGSSGAINTVQTVVQNVANITFVAGRAYLVYWSVNYYQQSTADTFAFFIGTANNGDAAGSTANITQLRSVSDRVSASSEGRNKIVSAYYFPTVTATLQVKALIQRVVGSGGSLFVSADASNPNQLIIEDKGLAA